MGLRAPSVDNPLSAPEVAPIAMPNVKFDTQIPEDAVGGGAANEKLMRAGEALASDISNFAKKHEEAANQVANNENELALSNIKNDLMGKALNTHGEAVFGLHKQVDDDFTKAIQEKAQDIQDPTQKKYFDNLAAKYRIEMADRLHKHVDNEIPQIDKSKTFALVENLQNDALSNWQDPEIVKKNLADIKTKVSEFAVREGRPEDADAQSRSQQGTVVAGVIKQMTQNGDIKGAQKFWAENKDKIDAARWPDIEAHLKDAQIDNTGSKLYDSMRGWVSPSGIPDLAKMRATVYKQPGLDDDQKDQVWKTVEAKANNDFRIHKQSEAINWDRFNEKAINMLNDPKATMEQAEVLAKKMGTTAQDIKDKLDYVRKLFTKEIPPASPIVMNSYSEWIESGRGNERDLTDAMNARKIDPHQYATLIGRLHDYQTGGPAESLKWAREDAFKKLADNMPADPQALATVTEKIRAAKSSEDIENIVEKQLKSVPTSKTDWSGLALNYNGDVASKEHPVMVAPETQPSLVESGEAPSKRLMGIYKTMGRQEGLALLKGLTIETGNTSRAFEMFDALKKEYGDIGPSSPVNNAIQSILRHNEAHPEKQLEATRANIATVLKYDKNGIYSW